MELRKEGFEIPVVISHLPNHEEIREGLLELINELDAPAWTEHGLNIARSSYDHVKLNQRWRRTFFDAARPHLSKVYAELKTPKWELQRAWFQSYDPGNMHHVHTHGGCTWANVYYLELSDPANGTVFYHPSRHWVELRGCLESDSPPRLQPAVQEGDIVTFPGYLEHESPVTTGEHSQSKTIISFNVMQVT